MSIGADNVDDRVVAVAGVAGADEVDVVRSMALVSVMVLRLSC